MDQIHITAASSVGVSNDGASTPKQQPLCEPERADRIAHDWFETAFGIISAGAAYPATLCAVVMCVGIGRTVELTLSGAPIGQVAADVLVGCCTLFALSMAGIALGGLWAAFFTGVTLPVLVLLFSTLRITANAVVLGAVAGGVVGFVAVLPPAMSILWSLQTDDILESLTVLALGPGLATILGQIGGAWGGSGSRTIPDGKQTLADSDDWQASPDRAPGDDSPIRRTSHAIQFNIRQLLWIAFWLSLLMSVIRLTGVRFGVAIPLLVGWTLYQFATLAAGAYLLRLLVPRWAARQRSRST